MSEQADQAPQLGPGTNAVPATGAQEPSEGNAAGTPAPDEQTIDTPDDLGGTGADEGGAG
jgi:hypothetical protein